CYSLHFGEYEFQSRAAADDSFEPSLVSNLLVRVDSVSFVYRHDFYTIMSRPFVLLLKMIVNCASLKHWKGCGCHWIPQGPIESLSTQYRFLPKCISLKGAQRRCLIGARLLYLFCGSLWRVHIRRGIRKRRWKHSLRAADGVRVDNEPTAE